MDIALASGRGYTGETNFWSRRRINFFTAVCPRPSTTNTARWTHHKPIISTLREAGGISHYLRCLLAGFCFAISALRWARPQHTNWSVCIMKPILPECRLIHKASKVSLQTLPKAAAPDGCNEIALNKTGQSRKTYAELDCSAFWNSDRIIQFYSNGASISRFLRSRMPATIEKSLKLVVCLPRFLHQSKISEI